MNTSRRRLLPLLAAATLALLALGGFAPPDAGAAGAATAVTAQPRRSPSAVRPFVQSFARRPEARPLTTLRRPKTPPTVAAGIDGCDHAYRMAARPGLCVPWRFPPRVADRCGWLRERGYLDPVGGAAVRLLVGRNDRHRLDTDGDGQACEEPARRPLPTATPRPSR